MTDRRISEIYRKVTLDMLLALVVPRLAAAARVALAAPCRRQVGRFDLKSSICVMTGVRPLKWSLKLIHFKIKSFFPPRSFFNNVKLFHSIFIKIFMDGNPFFTFGVKMVHIFCYQVKYDIARMLLLVGSVIIQII